MNRTERLWWLIYTICAITISGALVWVSTTVLRLERAEQQARDAAQHQDALRLALWRMDSFLLPLLSREAARPYYEYQAYYQEAMTSGQLLLPAQPGDILQPSPLLTTISEFIRLHFQFDLTGTISSPQVPPADQRVVTVQNCLPATALQQRETVLFLDVMRSVHRDEILPLVERLERAESERFRDTAVTHPLPSIVARGEPESQALQNEVEYTARSKNVYQTQRAAQLEANNRGQTPGGDLLAPAPSVGPLVALWVKRSESELYAFRCVRFGTATLLQGISFDWPKLRAALLAEVADLVAQPQLEPVMTPASLEPDASFTLASIPARLWGVSKVERSAPLQTPAVVMLTVAWLAVLAALAAGFATLRQSMAVGERRSRFASAVTHELRTPLTTFRLYSEMLAEGMITDPARRQLYLETLKSESVRLATLVENVLAYARLEEGRSVVRRDALTVERLLERVTPVLLRRAQDAGAELQVRATVPPALVLEVDVDAVTQILFNLVDNACKYARSSVNPQIEFMVECRGERLAITIADHGPGVPLAAARKIFAPFERADRNHDPAPGVGLGLALARGLARDLGGELSLSNPGQSGARFTLELPMLEPLRG